jgi:hypothetical protein
MTSNRKNSFRSRERLEAGLQHFPDDIDQPFHK